MAFSSIALGLNSPLTNSQVNSSSILTLRDVLPLETSKQVEKYLIAKFPQNRECYLPMEMRYLFQKVLELQEEVNSLKKILKEMTTLPPEDGMAGGIIP